MRLHQACRLWRQLHLPATAVATPAAPLCRRQGQQPPPWAAQLQPPVPLLKKQRAWEVRGRLHSLAAAQAGRRLQARHQGQRQWQQGQLRSATAPHLRQPPPQTQNSQPISLPLGLLWVSMHQQCLRFPAGPHAASRCSIHGQEEACRVPPNPSPKSTSCRLHIIMAASNTRQASRPPWLNTCMQRCQQSALRCQADVLLPACLQPQQQRESFPLPACLAAMATRPTSLRPSSIWPHLTSPPMCQTAPSPRPSSALTSQATRPSTTWTTSRLLC